MNSMFENNKSFNQNIKNWNVDKVKEKNQHTDFNKDGVLECKNNPFCAEKQNYLFEIEYNGVKQSFTYKEFATKAEAEANEGTHFSLYKYGDKVKCITGSLFTTKNIEVTSLKVSKGDNTHSFSNGVLSFCCDNIYFHKELDCFKNVELGANSRIGLFNTNPSQPPKLPEGPLPPDDYEGCSIDSNSGEQNGGYCAYASSKNSGMFLGADATNLSSEISNLSDFKWDSKDRIVITPTNGTGKYSDLHFKFNATQVVSGSQGGTGTNPYTITLGTDGDANKAFLLNVGENKTLSSNLSIDFANSQGFTYYLNSGGLKGDLTLEGNGKFIAYLLSGITGTISNTGVEATFNITNQYDDLLTTDSITADGGTNNFNFTSARENLATVEVNSEISEKNSGKNNFTLNSTTLEGIEGIKLVLKGATNQITAFTTFGKKQNTLTIETSVTNITIGTLILLNNLLIDNKSSKPITTKLKLSL